MLGDCEAAMMRFSSGSGKLPTAGKRHADLLKKSAQPLQYAAGGKKTPIMLANVTVSRDPQKCIHKPAERPCACVMSKLGGDDASWSQIPPWVKHNTPKLIKPQSHLPALLLVSTVSYKEVVLILPSMLSRAPLSQERSIISVESREMGFQSKPASVSAFGGASAVEGYVPRKHVISSATAARKEDGRPVQDQRMRFADDPGDGNATSGIAPPMVCICWLITVGRETWSVSHDSLNLPWKKHQQFCCGLT